MTQKEQIAMLMAKIAELEAKQSQPQSQPKTEEGVVKAIQYSEKAICVYGDTKPMKDSLRELGGKFCKGLTLDGKKSVGWIFSAKRWEDVNKTLNLQLS